jgi:hypothetical protein
MALKSMSDVPFEVGATWRTMSFIGESTPCNWHSVPDGDDGNGPHAVEGTDLRRARSPAMGNRDRLSPHNGSHFRQPSERVGTLVRRHKPIYGGMRE